jgi:simple sugar transport system substrate-binding protein
MLAAATTAAALCAMPIAAQDDPFTFGLVLVGPENDRGWSQAHTEGARYAAEQTGAELLIFQSLNPADAPETTLLDVVTEMVAQGAELIITTSDSFEEDTSAVAEAFPDVVFVNTTGSNVLEGAPPNVGNYNAQMEWMKLMAGCAAALTTETGQIGYLGPLINSETRRHASSAFLGARHCWETYREGAAEDLVFEVTWIGFWFNIPGVTLDPTEEANALLDNGADVLISGIDTTEALVVAGQRSAEGENVHAVPYDYVAACAEAEEVCLGVPFYNWGPYYTSLINDVRDDIWESAWIFEPPYWDDINNPDLSPAGFIVGDGLTEEASTQLDAFFTEMVAYAEDPANAETIFLWQGPLTAQDGSELAAEGEAVPLLDIWFLPALLDGMIGASE